MSYLDIPAAEPPLGVIPNYDHPESRRGLGLAACSTTLVLAFIFCTLRLYTRLKILRALSYDDCKLFR